MILKGVISNVDVEDRAPPPVDVVVEGVEADAALLVHSQKSEVVQGAEVEGEDEVAAKEAQGVSFGTQESGWQRRLDQTPGSFVKAIHPADVAKPEGLLA
ncbi:hypothetical protein I350_01902 [Cryptococcus amylolentus CBS 6273]|uniref:Uncharacterized protein n=1 Tax=Cryptococcus amylolentus CBS 6273 TaxID=1296118 RepID=A0A1E3K930_9TREE|nr:hypothetical protein I350_01902 [Cryptococcus amylolentus CBS 6273]